MTYQAKVGAIGQGPHPPEPPTSPPVRRHVPKRAHPVSLGPGMEEALQQS